MSRNKQKDIYCLVLGFFFPNELIPNEILQQKITTKEIWGIQKNNLFSLFICINLAYTFITLP